MRPTKTKGLELKTFLFIQESRKMISNNVPKTGSNIKSGL